MTYSSAFIAMRAARRTPSEKVPPPSSVKNDAIDSGMTSDLRTVFSFSERGGLPAPLRRPPQLLLLSLLMAFRVYMQKETRR